MVATHYYLRRVLCNELCVIQLLIASITFMSPESYPKGTLWSLHITVSAESPARNSALFNDSCSHRVTRRELCGRSKLLSSQSLLQGTLRYSTINRINNFFTHRRYGRIKIMCKLAFFINKIFMSPQSYPKGTLWSLHITVSAESYVMNSALFNY